MKITKKPVPKIINIFEDRTDIIKHIVGKLPEFKGVYYDMFLGNGELFALIQPKNAILNEPVKNLYQIYNVISQRFITDCFILKKFLFGNKCEPNPEWNKTVTDKERDFNYRLLQSYYEGNIKYEELHLTKFLKISTESMFYVLSKLQKKLIYDKDKKEILISDIDLTKTDFEIGFGNDTINLFKNADIVNLDVISFTKKCTEDDFLAVNVPEYVDNTDIEYLIRLFNKVKTKGVLICKNTKNFPKEVFKDCNNLETYTIKRGNGIKQITFKTSTGFIPANNDNNSYVVLIKK